MKLWLEKNDLEIYSTHNKRKSVITERFFRNLKNKIYKYITSISKNVYVDKIDYIVNQYNDMYYNTTKMQLVGVKSSTYINSSKEINREDPKFKIGYIVRIPKYKNIFAKIYVPNWSKDICVIKKLKTLSRGHMLLAILTEKKLLKRFPKKFAKNKSNRI